MPALSLLEWHPFSLTSSSFNSTDEICVRELGNFTKQLRQHAEAKAAAGRPVWVRVDGPYGNVGLDFGRHPVGVFVAGGVGITPIVGIVRSVYGLDDSPFSALSDTPKHVENLWKDPDATAGRQHIHIVWTVANEVCFLFPHFFCIFFPRLIVRSNADGFSMSSSPLATHRSPTRRVLSSI